MTLLSGCVSAVPSVITVEKVSCSTVPYINLSNSEIDALLLNVELHNLIVDIDKQSRIIDGCKK